MEGIKRPVRHDSAQVKYQIILTLHATGRYIGHMNNSLEKKEIMKKSEKESYRTAVRTQD